MFLLSYFCEITTSLRFVQLAKALAPIMVASGRLTIASLEHSENADSPTVVVSGRLIFTISLHPKNA
jgi:hypothetical protein